MALIAAGFDQRTGEELFVDTEAESPKAMTKAELAASGDALSPLTTGITPKKLPAVSREKAQFRGDLASGLTAGLQVSQQPTGTTDPLSFENIAQVGAGTAIGFLLGGVPGGAAAFAIGGLNSFLSSRSEKRKRKQSAKAIQIAQKAERERQVREDRFRQVNRLDALESQRFSRKQSALQSQWKGMETLHASMINLLNTNQTLKDRFATRGF